MPRFSLTFLVMLFAIVSGCATVAEMPSAALRAQKSVTVVASFGDTMSLQHVGTTVFNNVQSTQRVDGWKDVLTAEELEAETRRQRGHRRDLVDRGPFHCGGGSP